MSDSIIEIESPGTKANPIDTKNNIFIVQSLKPNTYFSYKCIKCGKIQSPVFFDKRHIKLYETFTCRSCRQTIDKTLIGRSKDNPYVINSIDDFDKIDLKYGTYVKFNCKQCGKEVIREWRPNRDNVCRKMTCENCNIKITSNRIYGTDRPQQCEELRKFNSNYMKSHPEIIQKGLETQRLNNGGLLHIQTEIGRKEQSDRAKAHPEWHNMAMESNRQNRGGLHNMQTNSGKQTCFDSNKSHHGGVLYTQTSEFAEYMRKLFDDDPEKCYFNTDEWEALRNKNWLKWRPSKYYFSTNEFQKLRKEKMLDWHSAKYNIRNIKFDSKWEFEYFIYCLDHGFDIVREPTTLTYTFGSNNEIHYYHPDFLVNGKLVEIKGEQFFKPDGTMYMPYRKSDWTDEDYKYYCDLYEAKHQCMISNNVKIIRRQEMDEIEDYIDSTYGKDFCDKFKVSDNENSNVVANTILPICINPNNLCYGYTPYNSDQSKEYQEPIGLGLTPFDISDDSPL